MTRQRRADRRADHPANGPANCRARGFTLVIVLWTVAVLALITTTVTATGRSELLLLRNIRDAAMLEAAADGAVHEAAFHMLDGSEHGWPANGQLRSVAVGALTAVVRVVNASGLINPNSAPPALMAALISRVGGDARLARALAAAIFDWRAIAAPDFSGSQAGTQDAAAVRPLGRPFADLDELATVPGMTPALLAALRPHLSLYNFGRVDPATADSAVAHALAEARTGQPIDQESGPVFLVSATVSLSGGARFVREAAVLLRPAPDGRPFRILAWDSGF